MKNSLPLTLARLLVVALAAGLVLVAVELTLWAPGSAGAQGSDLVHVAPPSPSDEAPPEDFVARQDLEVPLWSLGYAGEGELGQYPGSPFLGRYLPLELAAVKSGTLENWADHQGALFTTPSAYSDSTEWADTGPTFTWLDDETLWVASGSVGAWYARYWNYFIFRFEGETARLEAVGGVSIADDFSGTWRVPKSVRIASFADRRQVQLAYTIRYQWNHLGEQLMLDLSLEEPGEEPELIDNLVLRRIVLEDLVGARAPK